MISPRGCCGGGTITLHKILVRMSAVTHSGPLNRAAYVRVSPSIRCRREGLGVLSQMASEEHLGEVRRLRVDRVAVDTGRVETERRKSGAPGLRAVREKDVVPDIAGKDRHLGA